jgi:tetratricopeptide (TPR) repeat protein
VNIPKQYRSFLIPGFAFLLYAQTIAFGYALDDYLIILDNDIILSGLDKVQEIFSRPMTWGVGYNDGLYRPLPLLSHALEVALLGDHSAALGHFMNAGYYALLCFVLYKALLRVFPTHSNTVFWISLLFAAHPLHTEVVANIKSRDEIFTLLFAMLALWKALDYQAEKSAKHLIIALLAFAGALLSKESAIVFLVLIPLAMLLHANPKESKNYLVMFGALAVPTLAYLWLRNQVITVWVPPVDITNMYSKLANSLAPAEGLEKFGMAAYLVAKYFMMGIFPVNQAYEYSYNMIPIMPISNPWVLGAIAFNLALMVYMVKRILQRDETATGILFFYATIALFSNLFILIGVTFAERFAFMSSLGTLIAVVFGMKVLADKYPQIQKAIPMVLVLLLVAYSGKTLVRSTVWEDNEALFIGDYENNKNSVKAKYNAGTQYSRLSRETRDQQEVNRYRYLAIEKYKEALELYPGYRDANNNLGNIYLETGDYQAAIALFDKNLANNRANVNSIYNRAVAHFKLANYEKAKADFEWYLSLDRYGLPNVPLAHYYLGQSYGFLGNFEAAISTLNQAVTLNPNYWEAWQSIGKAYGMQGNFVEAEKNLLNAAKVSPNNEAILFDLAITYMNSGQKEKAKSIINRLIQLNPENNDYKGMLNAIQE